MISWTSLSILLTEALYFDKRSVTAPPVHVEGVPEMTLKARNGPLVRMRVARRMRIPASMSIPVSIVKDGRIPRCAND